MFIRTSRLLLRPAWDSDAPALYRAIADEGVVRNLAEAPWPYTPADAAAFVARERPADEPALAVFLRGEGPPALIGGIGLARMSCGGHELGYWIARAQWGRGYASEAVAAMIAAARHSLRIPLLHAGHFIDNPASGRVLAKAGFRPAGIAPRYSRGRGYHATCRAFTLRLADADGVPGDLCRKAA